MLGSIQFRNNIQSVYLMCTILTYHYFYASQSVVGFHTRVHEW